MNPFALPGIADRLGVGTTTGLGASRIVWASWCLLSALPYRSQIKGQASDAATRRYREIIDSLGTGEGRS